MHVSTAIVLVYAVDCVRILSMTKLLLKWCKYWNWTEIISKKLYRN